MELYGSITVCVYRSVQTNPTNMRRNNCSRRNRGERGPENSVCNPILRALSGALLYFAANLSAAIADERVPGAALVESSDTVEAVIFELAKLPLGKTEIEWFLRDADVVLAWANDNVDRWREADESDRPLQVIRAFPVWDEVDLSGSEFIATLAKLLFMQEFLLGDEQIKGLKHEIAQMDEALASGRLTGYVEEMAIREISKKQQFVDILEAAGTRNLKLYKANQERIDPVLDRFAQIGESP